MLLPSHFLWLLISSFALASCAQGYGGTLSTALTDLLHLGTYL